MCVDIRQFKINFDPCPIIEMIINKMIEIIHERVGVSLKNTDEVFIITCLHSVLCYIFSVCDLDRLVGK